MTLEELIEPFMRNPGKFPATLDTFFPQTIDLPDELHRYLATTWLDTEYIKHEEIGGNLIWVAGDYSDEPVVMAEKERGRPRSRSFNDSPPQGPGLTHVSWHRSPGEAPRRDKLWTVVKPVDLSIGTGGDSVTIPDQPSKRVVADFHTHPSTPGGQNQLKCGYQPPSIEDLMGFKAAERDGKDIFVKFVVTHTSELYAMVYIRGVSQFDDNKVFEIKLGLNQAGDSIKFPTSQAQEKYGSDFLKCKSQQDIRELERKTYEATQFGEKFAKQVKEYLKRVCNICSIGLYCGPVSGTLARLGV